MAWNCGYCAHLVETDLSNCPRCGTVRGMPVSAAADGAPRAAASQPAATRFADPTAASAHGVENRDFKMEGHLSAIALWYRIGGILGFICIGLVLLVAPLAIGAQLRTLSDQGLLGDRSADMLTFLVLIVVILAGVLLFSVGSLLLGRRLDRYSNGARIVAGALGAIGLTFSVLSTCGTVIGALTGDGAVTQALIASLNLAIGSLWSGAELWALFNQRAAVICTPAYRAAAAHKPLPRSYMYSSPFFWIPFVWVGVTFLLVIVAGVVGASLALAS